MVNIDDLKVGMSSYYEGTNPCEVIGVMKDKNLAHLRFKEGGTVMANMYEINFEFDGKYKPKTN